jgi:hypothetical protein
MITATYTQWPLLPTVTIFAIAGAISYYLHRKDAT